MSAALPLTPEELTPGWLADALGVAVAGVEVPEINWGTATKVLLRVSYAQDPGPEGPPRALCVKGGFREELRAYGIGEAYKIEARFFAEIAPGLDARLPSCWYAGVDDAHDQGIVVLDDLAAAGATFGDPTQPWGADLVAAALEQQAGWHRPTWGAKPGTYGDWLAIGAAPVRAAAAAFFTEEHYAQQFAIPAGPRLPESLSDRHLLQRAFERLWEHDDAAGHCLVHGDAHVGNTFIDAAGAPGFLDWQTPCLAPALYDVAYFIIGALAPEERRAAERDLLQHYLDALAAGGGPAIPWDEAWLDYRRHALHGFLWALTPPVMQTVERVVAMADRYTAAIDELEVLDVLGVAGAAL